MARQRRKQTPEPEAYDDGMIARAGSLARDNPMAAGGAIVMALTGCLIVANAVGFQVGRHPAPLFSTRDVIEDTRPAQTAGTEGAEDWRAVEAPVVSTLVLDLQQELRRVGLYVGPLDGLAGPATERSIRHFQRLRGMAETGEASEALLAMVALQGPVEADPPTQSMPIPRIKPTLAERAQPSPPAPVDTVAAEPVLRSPPEPEITASIPPAPVREMTADERRLSKIQEILSDLGYGPLVADGVMGENTAAAIRRFELDRGLPVKGVPSDTVVARLEMISGKKVR